MNTPRGGWARSFCCALALLIAAPAVSSAQSDPDLERARFHNARAKKLFSLGLFEKAAAEYKKAYDAKPMPAFLLNLAHCYKRMAPRKALERAAFYYESYLHNEPDTPLRPEIEKELKKLKRQIKQYKRAEQRKKKRVAAGGTPFYKSWWFWTIVGSVVAGATIGTTVAVTTSGRAVTVTELGSLGNAPIPPPGK